MMCNKPMPLLPSAAHLHHVATGPQLGLQLGEQGLCGIDFRQAGRDLSCPTQRFRVRFLRLLVVTVELARVEISSSAYIWGSERSAGYVTIFSQWRLRFVRRHC